MKKKNKKVERRNAILKALMNFFLPILISAIYLFVLFSLVRNSIWMIVGVLILSYFISPLGKEVLIPGAMLALLDLATPPFAIYAIILVATSVIFVDVMCSVFIIWNFDLITKIPKIGKFVLSFEELGRKKLEDKPDKRKLARYGLAAYVALPFQGSGGIMATIFGIFGGMDDDNVLMSVFGGSTIGCFAIAIPSYYIGEQILDIFGSTVSYLIGTFVLLGIITFLIIRYLKNRKIINDETEDETEDETDKSSTE